MSDTNDNIRIPKGVWTDLYALSGIPIGSQLIVENVGSCDVNLAVLATQPARDTVAYNVLRRESDVSLMNSLGDVGAWAYCNSDDSLVNVTDAAALAGFNPVSLSSLHDGFGNPITSYRGALNIHEDELHGQVINELFHLHTGDESTIAVASDPGDVSIQVVDDTDFTVGESIQINNGQIETTFPIITVKPGGNVLTLDRPLDFGYNVGDVVEVVHTDLRTTIGTLAAPIIHKIQPEPGKIWFINRIILTMTHTVAATDDKFGGIAALANGVVLRVNRNGQFVSFTNWKTNGDIILDMFDVNYSDKAGPSLFGTSGRGSFNRVGILVELNGDAGDFMDVLVQDDIQELASFFLNGQGYVEVAA